MDVKSASTRTTDVYSVRHHREEPVQNVVEAGIETFKEQKKERLASKESVEKQVDSLNELLQMNNTSLKFHIHEELNRTYVQVINRDTEEVMKEIPPEKFLDMVASMLKHAGLLVDKRI